MAALEQHSSLVVERGKTDVSEPVSVEAWKLFQLLEDPLPIGPLLVHRESQHLPLSRDLNIKAHEIGRYLIFQIRDDTLHFIRFERHGQLTGLLALSA
ncbi:MAG: hypothetical protein H7X93_13685 [Sphingomonadaceae bacterium]|nr:hypothetical protein [Sphingomonadaceae bacterium]